MIRSRQLAKFVSFIGCWFALGGCARVSFTPLQTDAKTEEAIRTFLKSTYASEGLRRIEAAKQAPQSDAQSQKLVDDIAAMQKIEFKSLKARGTPMSNVIRAEITVDGKAPPDGINVRYYQAKRLTSGDWQIEWETNEATYNKNLRLTR